MIASISIPFGPIKMVSGHGVVLNGDDIDTDRIIPARFLRCVTFDKLGEQVFADDRIELNGAHPFDSNKQEGTKILIVNSNFGCGSSREHAPQALLRWGIRAIVGESFAEIFFGNCLALGVPCLTADKNTISIIQNIALDSNIVWTIDINHRIISKQDQSWPLYLAEGPQHMFMSGIWDTTAQLISSKTKVEITATSLPYLSAFS